MNPPRQFDADLWINRSAALSGQGDAAKQSFVDGVSDSATSRLQKLRTAALGAFLRTGWIVTAFLAIQSLTQDARIWWIVAASALINLGAAQYDHLVRTTQSQRIAAVLLASLQPIAFLTGLRLSGFEALTPLALCVAITALSTFCDRRAILAAGVIALILLFSLSVFAPGWLFVGHSLGRDLIYAVEICVVIAVAARLAATFQRLIEDVEASRLEAATQAELLGQQAQELELALHRVELERQERERVEGKQAIARKEDMHRISLEFQNTVSVVARSISKTAAILDRTTKALNTMAKDTGESAYGVSISAEAASSAARNVARGITELSSSIANIAVTVSQQNDLSSSAIQRSSAGGDAMCGLTRHSETIEQATRTIVRIAEKTNLLSLNAAIEAATAGPAGRGFTIVAQEVKSLAMQASEAATEINDFLTGVRSGTLDAQRSFNAIDAAITELADATTAIQSDVEKQRKSADAIEAYARNAANDVGSMAERSRALASTVEAAKDLSAELENASAEMLVNVRNLEKATEQFTHSLQAD